ncbi:hypothetical protein LINPERHAP1_LOCUS19084 [Linum perenne]
MLVECLYYVECVLKLCAWFAIIKTLVWILPMLWGPLWLLCL